MVAGYLRMLGQVTTGEPVSAQIRLTPEGPTGHVHGATDDVGQLRFDPLLAGDYRVTVHLSHRAIVLPWVPVRPRFPLDHADLVTALGLTAPSPREDVPADPPDPT